jgi:putative tryptophan/tyrosine transport system substrate-binding protein
VRIPRSPSLNPLGRGQQSGDRRPVGRGGGRAAACHREAIYWLSRRCSGYRWQRCHTGCEERNLLGSVAVADPVGQQIVNSLARPGGNATGLAQDSLELITTRLRLLKELVPKLSRLAVIVRNDPGLEQRLLDLRRVAEPMAIKVREFEAPTGGALQRAFMWLDRSDAIYVASSPLGPAKRADIIARAAKARIPAIYPFRAFPAAGGLMSFGTDEKDLFRRAAIMVDKILKGSKPSELPVEQPTKFELIVNLSTAKALGLTLPESILAQANEVIE